MTNIATISDAEMARGLAAMHAYFVTPPLKEAEYESWEAFVADNWSAYVEDKTIGKALDAMYEDWSEK